MNDEDVQVYVSGVVTWRGSDGYENQFRIARSNCIVLSEQEAKVQRRWNGNRLEASVALTTRVPSVPEFMLDDMKRLRMEDHTQIVEGDCSSSS